MRKFLFLSIISCSFAVDEYAQGQKDMLFTDDPKLAENKKLVYDFGREILEGGHLQLASKYMQEGYIEHNPNVPTGRQRFIDFYSKLFTAKPIVDTIKAPLIAIVAEGNLIVLCFRREHPDPKDPTKQYVTTWFDMLRVEDGKVAEHWGLAIKK